MKVISASRQTVRKQRRERERQARDRVDSYLNHCLAGGVPVDERFLLQLSKLVLQDNPKYAASAGHYRKGPVVVRWRHRVVYRPPGPEPLPSAIEDFLALADSGSGGTPVGTAGLACLHILKAHPFVEGNGRTARGVATYILLRGGYVARPFKSLETFVDLNVEEYYAKLGQSTLESPGPWLKYFARAANHAYGPPGESNPTGRLLVRAAP